MCFVDCMFVFAGVLRVDDYSWLASCDAYCLWIGSLFDLVF